MDVILETVGDNEIDGRFQFQAVVNENEGDDNLEDKKAEMIPFKKGGAMAKMREIAQNIYDDTPGIHENP